MAALPLTGLDNVMRNLAIEIKKMRNRSMKGLIKANILIRRDMEDTPPLIPVDTGNLRASYFAVTSDRRVVRGASPSFKGANKAEMAAEHAIFVDEQQADASGSREPLLILGFSANYAWFVHEMIGANFAGPIAGSRREGAGAKFFEAALNRQFHNILRVIRDNARVR